MQRQHQRQQLLCWESTAASAMGVHVAHGITLFHTAGSDAFVELGLAGLVSTEAGARPLGPWAGDLGRARDLGEPQRAVERGALGEWARKGRLQDFATAFNRAGKVRASCQGAQCTQRVPQGVSVWLDRINCLAYTLACRLREALENQALASVHSGEERHWHAEVLGASLC